VKLGFGIRRQVKFAVQIAIYSPFEWYVLSFCCNAVATNRKLLIKLPAARAAAEWLKRF